MATIFKNIGLVLLGIIIAIGVASLVTAIGCAVNGISFTQQIVQWAGGTANITPAI